MPMQRPPPVQRREGTVSIEAELAECRALMDQIMRARQIIERQTAAFQQGAVILAILLALVARDQTQQSTQ
eukprot:COSAG01_NODE_587_length_15149_cov_13.592558_10_plen_71_part_00